MFKLGDVVFGDNVRIVDSESTRRSGHASRNGVCHGLTTPSVTAVDVVGEPADDVALNVYFDDPPIGDAWFAPDVVELVDHAGGSRATVGDASFVKQADGEWVQETASPRQPAARRRWFRRT